MLLVVLSIFEGDLSIYVHASDFVGKWSQAFNGSTKKTQSDHEVGG